MKILKKFADVMPIPQVFALASMILFAAGLAIGSDEDVGFDDPTGGSAEVACRAGDTPQFTRVTNGDIVNDGGSSYSASWVDYDGDGHLDLYVGNAVYPNGEINFLYHNEQDGSFTRTTGDVVTTDIGMTYGHAWADYDHDGDMDLYATRWLNRKNCFYTNDGDGTFTKVTDAFTGDYGYSTNCSWIDYDGDGDLDLYVTNEHASSPYSSANYLYRNDGSAFTKVTDQPPVSDVDNSHGIAWGDYDNDGDMDLFVANAFGATGPQSNRLYNNGGGGTFTKVTAGPVVTDATISTCGSWGDYDNDGDLDLFVANTYGNNSNSLYDNNGDGTFTKVTSGDIVNDYDWTWGCSWADYDNDGDLDILATTTVADLSHSSRNYVYENNGNGSFTKITSGVLVTETGWFWGGVWGDYDQDGDLDLFIAKAYGNNEDNALFTNIGNSNTWINVKCVGTTSNASGIGSRVRVKATIDGNPVWQMREITSASGYTTQHSMWAHFGLGNASFVDSIEVRWPTGERQVLEDVEVNQRITITEELSFVCGDADGSGAVDIDDAVFLIQYIFAEGPAPDPYEAGDANESGVIDIDDVVYLVAYIFSGGPEPCAISC